MSTRTNNTRKIVGVKFRTNGKIYGFDCGSYVLQPGDYVIVETERGLGFGIVDFVAIAVKNDKIEVDNGLKKIFRKADAQDLKQFDKNKELEKKAYVYCMASINKLSLKMNLFFVETTFDADRLIFFFTSENRIDFRQLVKSLVKRFHIRIEMRQVGVRNQAKMCGGVGRCGRVLCCKLFLNKFEPVSIKMAKYQGLSLNPSKISGQCGRLMCCLTFENEIYKEIGIKFVELNKLV